MIGTWEGSLEAGGAQLRIVFNIERGDDGSLSGTMDSPDQGRFGIPLSSVTLDGSDVTFGVAAVGGEYTGRLLEAGDDISGTWSQGPNNLPLDLAKAEGPAARPPRPQEPKPPFPYDMIDVTFANAEAGIELEGTLTTPRGAGPFPGVVLVSGSGPQDRDESLLGHKPFLVLADHLTRNGIAVLRFDDRGVGESAGDVATATSDDFTSDALAAVSFLRRQESVAARRVGIAGHSEGGLIAPIAADRSDEVSYIVMLAGPGVPGIDILIAQGELINRAGGAPEEVIELNQRIQAGLADIVAEESDREAAAQKMKSFIEREVATLSEQMRASAAAGLSEEAISRTVAQFNSPWFRFFLHHDPRPALERLDVPVLSLIGEKDPQVPHGLNNPEIEAAFERGGNPDATVRMLPGLNHLFQEAETGSPAEYQQIEETMNTAALEAVSAWILERFGPGIG